MDTTTPTTCHVLSTDKFNESSLNRDYSFLPIKEPSLISFYYSQREIRWLPADIDMRSDKDDFETLKKSNKVAANGVLISLDFFSKADGLVVDNSMDNFRQETSFLKEARAFYAEQAACEMVHSETYSLMANSILGNSKTFRNLTSFDECHPVVKRINEFILYFMDRSRPLMLRVIIFAFIEGTLFTSVFAFVYWLKRLNIIKGFVKGNEWIARDETLHMNFAIELFSILQKYGYKRESEEVVFEAIRAGMQVAKDFADILIEKPMIGMSSKSLYEYSQCTVDHLLVSCGYEKLYNIENPYDWMTIIALPNRTNFFEGKVSEYSKESNESAEKKLTFDSDDDF